MLDMNCYDRITHTQKSLNFLVVGPKGSGKKSLLQYSSINCKDPILRSKQEPRDEDQIIQVRLDNILEIRDKAKREEKNRRFKCIKRDVIENINKWV